MAGYILWWCTCPQTITHPSITRPSTEQLADRDQCFTAKVLSQIAKPNIGWVNVSRSHHQSYMRAMAQSKLACSRLAHQHWFTLQQLPAWLGGVVVGRRISDREVASSIPGCSAATCNSGQLFTHVCLCSPSSINWYRLRLGVKCTTGAVLGMLAAIRRILRLVANRRHYSIVLTCGCRCTAALMWLLSLTPLYKLM